jgi:hypothetical protein
MNLLDALINHIEKYKPESCKKLIDFYPLDIQIKLKAQDVEWLSVGILKKELEMQKSNGELADHATLYTFIFNSFVFINTKEGYDYWNSVSRNFYKNPDSYKFRGINKIVTIKYLL